MKGHRSGPRDVSAPHRLRALLSPEPPEFRAPPAVTLRSSADPAEPAAANAPTDGGAAAAAARPAPWSGRFELGPPGARALVAVGVVTALIAAGYLWMARPRPEPVPAAEMRPAPAQPAQVSASAGSLVVHVAGKVRRPGVVTLPAGARVTDAIKAVGGLRPGAKIGVLNLARHVVDGEQILVGIGGPAAPATPVAPGGSAPGAAPGMPLDLNSATVEQFDQLPGVGPVLAQRIVEYRTRHGPFRSVDQLQEVTGIGERRYADLKDLVRV